METAVTHIARYAHLLTLPVGSLDGLINLRQRLCQISGIHLLDETGEYNTPYVRRIFPDRDMQLITLAHRTQGLISAPGNPLGIHATSDLPQTGLRFINRNPGSGTRLWLDNELKKLAIPFETIAGYQHTLNTHLETARAVAEGRADATLGLQAAAHKFGLSFTPLFHERYDLIFPRDLSVHMDILLNFIQSGDFRHQLAELRGYESTHTGELVAL
ncbi:MAG: substrate-binding domain-containing protein [Anaerolineaceae bacterium]|nr:substrate-binding domain-containing protein [Anaerolineaceae bacterium]